MRDVTSIPSDARASWDGRIAIHVREIPAYPIQGGAGGWVNDGGLWSYRKPEPFYSLYQNPRLSLEAKGEEVEQKARLCKWLRDYGIPALDNALRNKTHLVLLPGWCNNAEHPYRYTSHGYSLEARRESRGLYHFLHIRAWVPAERKEDARTGA